MEGSPMPNEVVENGISHGARPAKQNRRKRKGAMDYASENQADFTVKTILNTGALVDVLVCRFCAVPIGARSDRIKEHLASKRHIKLKREGNLFAEASNVIKMRSNADLGTAFAMSKEKSVDTRSAPSRKTLTSAALKFAMQSEVAETSEQGSSEVHIPNGETPSFSSSVLVSGTPSGTKGFTHLIIKWNKYGKVYRQAFRNFQAGGLFTDVSLVAEGKQIDCHKLVLCAGSEYFLEVLQKETNLHPVILMHKTPFWQLDLLVKYLYKGDILVRQEQLAPLLKTAEQLGIRGLCLTNGPSDSNGPAPGSALDLAVTPNYVFQRSPQAQGANMTLTESAPESTGPQYSANGNAATTKQEDFFAGFNFGSTGADFLPNGTNGLGYETDLNAAAGSSSMFPNNSPNLPGDGDFRFWPLYDNFDNDIDVNILAEAAKTITNKKRKFSSPLSLSVGASGDTPGDIFNIGLSDDCNNNNSLT